MANVQSFSILSSKRLGIRMANVQSGVTFWATVLVEWARLEVFNLRHMGHSGGIVNGQPT